MSKNDLIEELNDALCELLHEGDELGDHTPASHLALFYKRERKPTATKKKKSKVDWYLVEQYIRRSITGRLKEPDRAAALFCDALAEDPGRYQELHTQVKEQEMAKLNPLMRVKK